MKKSLILMIFFSANAFGIKNGIKTSYYEYQNIVKLQIGQSICTGVRISAYYVITVSHCFVKKKFKYFNVKYLDDNSENKIKITSEKVFKNDIIFKSINKLDREIAIFPIHPFYPDAFLADNIISHSNELIENAEGEIVGFGTNIWKNSFGLNKGFVSIGDLKFDRSFSLDDSEEEPQVLYVYPRTGLGAQQLACPGDSGGPLYIEKSGVRYLIGIVSRILATKSNRRTEQTPEGYCKRGLKSVYLPILFHQNFLLKNTDINLD